MVAPRRDHAGGADRVDGRWAYAARRPIAPTCACRSARCPPSRSPGFDPIYYSYLSSEYLADDLSEFLHSEAFAGEVRRELATQRNMNVDVDYILNATRTKKTHRFIDITVTTPTFEEGQEIAGSISRILSDQARVAGYLRASRRSTRR